MYDDYVDALERERDEKWAGEEQAQFLHKRNREYREMILTFKEALEEISNMGEGYDAAMINVAEKALEEFNDE